MKGENNGLIDEDQFTMLKIDTINRKIAPPLRSFNDRPWKHALAV
jgi:hypothetical protein